MIVLLQSLSGGRAPLLQEIMTAAHLLTVNVSHSQTT